MPGCNLSLAASKALSPPNRYSLMVQSITYIRMISVYWGDCQHGHLPMKLSGCGTMPIHIEDDATAYLINQLAVLRGVTTQAAVRLAVEAELQRTKDAMPLRDRLAAFWVAHPPPPPTGQLADKAFFDELSGEP